LDRNQRTQAERAHAAPCSAAIRGMLIGTIPEVVLQPPLRGKYRVTIDAELTTRRVTSPATL
ncbi:MAG: hypothetical protein Q7U54_03685, partial [Bacteroidales bacterium]|nr:hypothetical protein [Bacteroidales bacterium]